MSGIIEYVLLCILLIFCIIYIFVFKGKYMLTVYIEYLTHHLQIPLKLLTSTYHVAFDMK